MINAIKDTIDSNVKKYSKQLFMGTILIFTILLLANFASSWKPSCSTSVSQDTNLDGTSKYNGYSTQTWSADFNRDANKRSCSNPSADYTYIRDGNGNDDRVSSGDKHTFSTKDYEWLSGGDTVEVRFEANGVYTDWKSESFPKYSVQKPSNLRPTGTEFPPVTLRANVEDNSGNDMDVTFRESDGSYIGRDNNVCSGCTASVSWDPPRGSTLAYYAVADDGETTATSNTKTFETYDGPDAPTNPTPENGKENVPSTRDLSIDVNHPQGESMDVTFRINDGSGWVSAGTDTNVPSGGTATANPDLDYSKDYDWYAEAEFGPYSTKSSEYVFTTEDRFFVDTANVAPDGQEQTALNPDIEVPVYHSDPDTTVVVNLLNGTGDTVFSKSVEPSGSLETVTFDTSSIDSIGGSPGTNYDYGYEVTDGKSSNSDIIEEGFTFKTISAPEVNVLSPSEGDKVGINDGLELEVQQAEGVSVDTRFILEGNGGSDNTIKTVTDTATATPASTPLQDYSFVEQDNTYKWRAEAIIGDPGSTELIKDKSSEIEFETVERPEVTETAPSDEEAGLDPNPALETTVVQEGGGDINVSFYDWEIGDSASEQARLGSEEVSSGETAKVDIQDEDIGNSIETHRWYVVIESDEGGSWNNSDNPYEFSVSEISDVNYTLENFQSGQNLNPGSADSPNLDGVYGPEELKFRVKGQNFADLQEIGFEVERNGETEVIERIQNVPSGKTVSVNVSKSSIVSKNTDAYNLTAFYSEGQNDFVEGSLASDPVEFSTHVTELKWNSSAVTDKKPIREYLIYYNNQPGQEFTEFAQKGIVPHVSGKTSYHIGIANKELGQINPDNCFRITARNIVSESDPTEERCVGKIF